MLVFFFLFFFIPPQALSSGQKLFPLNDPNELQMDYFCFLAKLIFIGPWEAGGRAFLWRGHRRRIPTILTETLEPQCPYSTSIKQAYTRVALY